MKHLTSAITLFFLVSLNYAFCDCRPNSILDLRVQNSKIFAKLPIKNQKEYGVCYAYSAATLIEYFKLKKNDKRLELISPVEAAIFTSEEVGDEDEEGGDVCSVVKALSQRGTACPETSPSEESRYKDLSLYFHRELVKKVFLPYALKEEVFKPVPVAKFNSRASLALGQKRFLARFDNFYKDLHSEMLHRGFSSHDIPDDKDIFIFSQKWHIKNRYTVLREMFIQLLIAKTCLSHSVSVPRLSCEHKTRKGGVLDYEIDLHLENRKEPLGITFCSTVLNNKNAEAVNRSGGVSDIQSCGAHAAVIIGKRGTADGKCEYLIRNSWGKSYSYSWKTSNGDIWIDGKALMKNLLGIQIVTLD